MTPLPPHHAHLLPSTSSRANHVPSLPLTPLVTLVHALDTEQPCKSPDQDVSASLWHAILRTFMPTRAHGRHMLPVASALDLLPPLTHMIAMMPRIPQTSSLARP